eukprot:13255479-Ditylum_brightwellii.AAC.1
MLTFKGYDKELWSSKVITTIWSIFRQTWNARNEHLKAEMATTYSSTSDLQIWKALYLQHSMNTSDQLLFHMLLAEQLQTSQESKAMWLNSVRIA